MQQLSVLDALFLYAETPDMPMHVGCLCLLDVPRAQRAGYFKQFRRHIAQRLHLLPLFQRQLAELPLRLAPPFWVNAGAIDLDDHLHRSCLPRPGNAAQLAEHVAALHAIALPRDKPLWRFDLIEGLEGGQLALYVKLHHAALDGEAAMALASILLDPSAAPPQVAPPSPSTAAERPASAVLVGMALGNTVVQYSRLAKWLPSAMLAMGGALNPFAHGAKPAGPGRGAAPATPFNCLVGRDRIIATASLSLSRVRGVGKQAGATVNDVVLALCAGALRRYLDAQRALPAKPLLAAVPVSLRAAGDGAMNNQVSFMLASLATDIDAPLKRLQAIHAAAAAAKQGSGSVAAGLIADYPSLFAPWLMSSLKYAYADFGLAGSLPPLANVVVSNMRGAAQPRYLCGAKLTSSYPLGIPFHGYVLNISVQSYGDALDFGLVACRRSVPQLATLAGFLGDALDELEAAAFPEPPSEATVVTARKPPRKGGKRAP